MFGVYELMSVLVDSFSDTILLDNIFYKLKNTHFNSALRHLKYSTLINLKQPRPHLT